MSKHIPSSTDTSSSDDAAASEVPEIVNNRSGNKKRKKTSILKCMKHIITCGVPQPDSSSPPSQSTEPKEKSTNSMATIDTSETTYHTVECNGVYYTIPDRYENPAFAGKGNFGAVIRARDKVLNEDVAIKKMLKPFDSSTHAKRTYRELKLLTHLKDPSAQVVQLFNVFTPDKTPQNFQSLYFVFNYASKDLNTVIEKRKPIVESTIRQIMYALLCGLKFMHSAGVIHRDLKPSNVGIDSDGNVFILDFGLARVASKGIQTGYVATRWWRAPEIVANWEHYDEKVDVWSAGCIMAELVLLKPIFPGSDLIQQLKEIFRVIGTPSSELVNKICAKDAAEFINGLKPKSEKMNYQDLFGYKYDKSSITTASSASSDAKGTNQPATKRKYSSMTDGEKNDELTPKSGLSADGIDLLDKLLTFDYNERPTAQMALEHKFFKGLHEQADEPVAKRLVDEHDDATHSISTWKGIIWQMIQEFSPPSSPVD